MRKLLIAATLAASSFAARADSLPGEFLGWWCLDQYNDFQITPQSIRGGGADCRLTSIKAEVSKPAGPNDQRTYLVDMICAGWGALPPMVLPARDLRGVSYSVREMWAMRNIGTLTFMVMASVTSHHGRIDILLRPPSDRCPANTPGYH